MTKQDTSKTLPVDEDRAVDTAEDANRQMIQAVMDMQSDGARRIANVNAEMLRFAAQRMQTCQAVWGKVAAPTTPAAAAAIWGDYLAGAAEEYSEEFRRLMDMYTAGFPDAVLESQKQVQDAISAAYLRSIPKVGET